MATPHIDVESLVTQNQASSAIESRLASLLEPALNSVAATELTADTTAADIDALFSDGHDSEDKAENFLYALWNFFLGVAKKVPADDDARQGLLVNIVGHLKERQHPPVKVWGQDVEVWKGLPLLGAGMRDAWNFTPSFDDKDKPDAVTSWLSLNSFAARALGTSVTDWTNFAIWGLREALETPHRNAAARDGHLGAAHEWIVHAGRVLLDEGRSGKPLDDAAKRMFKPGPLFEGGNPGLSGGRWAFWRQRLETLAEETDSEEAKASAREALDYMKSLDS